MTKSTLAMPAFSLAHLTALSLSPPELVSVAAQAGYAEASLRLLPAASGGIAYPLMDEPALLRETLACMEATGIRIFDLEIVWLNAGFRVDDYHRFLETGARLGARAVLAGSDDPEPARRAAAFAALCEAAHPYGLSINIEFMPWTAVANLRSAVQLFEAAGCPANGGILIDALHFARSDSTLEEVRRLPRQWLHYAQICDAPATIPSTHQELIHTARCERLLPGEGGIALAELWQTLPRDLPVGVEIPHHLRAPAVGPLAWASQALAAVRGVIAALP